MRQWKCKRMQNSNEQHHCLYYVHNFLGTKQILKMAQASYLKSLIQIQDLKLFFKKNNFCHSDKMSQTH